MLLSQKNKASGKTTYHVNVLFTSRSNHKEARLRDNNKSISPCKKKESKRIGDQKRFIDVICLVLLTVQVNEIGIPLVNMCLTIP
jgi:hypothetical protein